jgi:hypothetical protein
MILCLSGLDALFGGLLDRAFFSGRDRPHGQEGTDLMGRNRSDLMGKGTDLRNSLWLLLSGKKPYATPDTRTFETACGCFFQVKAVRFSRYKNLWNSLWLLLSGKSRTPLPIQEPLKQPVAASLRQKAVLHSRYKNLWNSLWLL